MVILIVEVMIIIVANQSDEWKEFLTNSPSSPDNSKIHSNLSEITISEPT